MVRHFQGCQNLNKHKKNCRELLCGTTDHSIQVPPPPIILRSAQVISVNDEKNISLTKPKTPKKAVTASPGKPAKKKPAAPGEGKDQKSQTTAEGSAAGKE